MEELIQIRLSETDKEELGKLTNHLSGHKYENYLHLCFSTIVNIKNKMFVFDQLLVDRMVKSFVNLRRETFNNPRVLKLRDDHGVDIQAQLVVTTATTFGDFLYQNNEDNNEEDQTNA